ncbi:MAG: hypothetical protein ACMXX7_02565 [Candidatus Woesearchaeota archaeon]
MKYAKYIIFILLILAACDAENINGLNETQQHQENITDQQHQEAQQTTQDTAGDSSQNTQSSTDETQEIIDKKATDVENTLAQIFSEGQAIKCEYNGLREYSGEEFYTEFEVYMTQNQIKTTTIIEDADPHISIMDGERVYLSLTSDSRFTGIPQMLVDTTGCEWLVLEDEQLEIDLSLTPQEYQQELDENAKCAQTTPPSFEISGNACSLDQLQNIFD